MGNFFSRETSPQEKREDGFTAAETVLAYSKWLEYERNRLANLLTSASEMNSSGASKNVLQVSTPRVQEVPIQQLQPLEQQQQPAEQQPGPQQPMVQQAAMQPTVQHQPIFVVPPSPHQFIYLNDDARSYNSMRGRWRRGSGRSRRSWYSGRGYPYNPSGRRGRYYEPPAEY